MNQTKTPTQWMKKRHRIIFPILIFFLRPICRILYGIKPEPFKEQGNRQYLILLNHQTPFDQFFVPISFKGPVYFLSTEDLFSLGWVSNLLRWLVAPIPIKKQTTDVAAVMNCIRVAREGGTIAMAPEGNRTYSGKTEYINPAVASMAKKLNLPIALYRIEGGYGVEPRWSNVTRRGKIRSYVSRVIEPEEYQSMSKQELAAAIEEGLYVNEAVADSEYHHNKRAEYLERLVYICPDCGFSKFESHGNYVRCCTCGKQVEYGVTKELHCHDTSFPFRFVNDWYEYQKDYINQLDVLAHTQQPLFRDKASMKLVIPSKHKKNLRKWANLALYGDRIVVDEGKENELILPFSQLSAVTVLGRNKVNVYHNKEIYQFKGSKRFNAIKYVHIYNRYKNLTTGNPDSTFLGL